MTQLATTNELQQGLVANTPAIEAGTVKREHSGLAIDTTQNFVKSNADYIGYVQVLSGIGNMYIGVPYNVTGALPILVQVPLLNPASRLEPGTLLLAKVSV